jgi:hypothetical protein
MISVTYLNLTRAFFYILQMFISDIFFHHAEFVFISQEYNLELLTGLHLDFQCYGTSCIREKIIKNVYIEKKKSQL